MQSRTGGKFTERQIANELSNALSFLGLEAAHWDFQVDGSIGKAMISTLRSSTEDISLAHLVQEVDGILRKIA